MKWTAVILGAWGAVLGTNLVQSQMPSSSYFEPYPLHVYDAQTAECPAMDYERNIWRPFHATWTATIERKSQVEQGFWVYKVFEGEGEGDYSPEAITPPQIDLCWWVWADTIHLPPGEYRVRTLWRLDVPGGTKEIRRGSNVFTVSAAH